MSNWINRNEADRVRDEIKAMHSRADVTVERHPVDDSLFRLSLTLRDPNTGHMVLRQAEADTDGAAMLADARAEMSRRGKRTRSNIQRERRAT